MWYYPFKNYLLLREILRKVNQIMATAQETAQELRDLKTQVARNRQEVLAKIAALEAAANSGNLAEIQAAVADLKTEIQASDDDVVPAA